MSEKRVYPRKAWVLTPSFKPKEVELVRAYNAFGGTYYGDITTTDKLCRLDELHESKDAAVADGWLKVAKMQADLKKRNESLSKKIKELEKAVQGKPG
ncbi:MAG: hypothetical protein V4772_08930 [Pseudomonadota bacterium]